MIVAARRAERRRHPGVGAAEHHPRRRRLRDAAAARAARLRARLQRLDAVAANVHWGVAPTWSNLLLSIPVAMIAYTGIETVSNLAEEARDPVRTIPRSIGLVAVAVFAIYFTLPLVALSALPVELIDGELTTLLALTPEEGGYQNDPILGVVDNLGDRGRAARRAPDLRRHPRGDDPLHRHERGRSSARRGSRTRWRRTGSCPERFRQAPPAVQDAVARARRVRRLRLRSSCCCPAGRRSSARCTRSARCCRSRSPTRRSSSCAGRTAARSSRFARARTSGSAASTGRCSRSSAGRRDLPRVARGRRPGSADAVRGARAGWRSGCSCYVVYRRRVLHVAAHRDGARAAALRAGDRARVPHHRRPRRAGSSRRARQCTWRRGSQPSGARRSSPCA